MTKIPPHIRKKAEFEAFIKILKGNTVAHWVQIAQALGVDKDTITEWRKLPEAQEAIKEGIRNNLEGMERAGSKDWRMYESKAKMLGISPVEKQDITSGGEKVRPILGGISDDSNTSDNETEQTPEEN